MIEKDKRFLDLPDDHPLNGADVTVYSRLNLGPQPNTAWDIHDHTHPFDAAAFELGLDDDRTLIGDSGHRHIRNGADDGWSGYNDGHAHEVPKHGAGRTGKPGIPPSRRT